MENGVERPVVRRAMESGGERRAMENGRPEVRRAMESGDKGRAKENGGERKAMEYSDEMMEDWDLTMPVFASEMVMCSTCGGFVMRKKRRAFPDPGKEVVEVVMEAEKMRDLLKAFLLHGPFQEMEPAGATKQQWQVLRRRRLIMMETKRCPACSRSVLMCPTCFLSLSEKTAGAGPGEEDKAAGSKEKKSSSEVGSEFMADHTSQGGKERKKIATEDEAMRSVKKSKRLSVESSGSRSLKKSKSEDKEGSGSKNKANRSSKMEGSRPKEVETEEGSGSKKKANRSSKMEGSGPKEVETEEGSGSKKKSNRLCMMDGSGPNEVETEEGSGSKKKANISSKMDGSGLNVETEEGTGSKKKANRSSKTEEGIRSKLAKMEVRESAGGNGKKTKMVTMMFDKKSISTILRDGPRFKPCTYDTLDPILESMFADDIREYEVDCEFHEYLRRQFIIRGYAEYQMEVTDDEDK